MSSAKTDYLERKVLDHVLGTASFTSTAQCYVALFTTINSDGTAGAEVTGGSYARQAVDFDVAATDGGVTTAPNTADVVFTDMPDCTVVGLAIYDASTAGNQLYHVALPINKELFSGDDLTFPAASINIREM